MSDNSHNSGNEISLYDYERPDYKAIMKALKEKYGPENPSICIQIEGLEQNMREINRSMADHIGSMNLKIEELLEMLKDHVKDEKEEREKCVKKEGEYSAIRAVVFGGVGLVLITIGGWGLGLIYWTASKVAGTSSLLRP